MPSARREALPFLLGLFLLTCVLLGAWALWPFTWPITVPLALVVIVLFVFVLYFFRDPERMLPADENIIVAAADGLVVSIEQLDEPNFGLGRMQRVAIFLSVFDVHINRSPVAGRVVASTYKAGQFLDVRHVDASALNEYRAWHLDSPRGPVAVRQIAGLIARRIIAWSREGCSLTRGERFGMIRFGSRTEIYLPLECTILVQPGDRVQGAATPIARWPSL